MLLTKLHSTTATNAEPESHLGERAAAPLAGLEDQPWQQRQQDRRAGPFRSLWLSVALRVSARRLTAASGKLVCFPVKCLRSEFFQKMAHSYQTSTLSLTLPISCQICLGKVKQPVICANYHVFCSSCMQMWLKKASQCPSCRVSITPENPCREIIGGTNENYNSDDPSIKQCLRKTRGELLLQEYEDEIDGLMRENKELKGKNLNLESRLKCLNPVGIESAQTQDQTVDPQVREELTTKLQLATECCDKVQQDMDKLKEVNKTLRSQSVDLIQENMRLKAEVASRSPQKFGRFTVAALEAKIQQYERDVEHLKRALERSDQYIEDLESRLRKAENRQLDVQERPTSSKAEA
ncbi:hypothetical protein fugu_003236 [Takifugu bimaculatus]|uniref:RING-type domain-containing protein n=1 Tax=Takifugu bimaculatus TaxID=433685 RepID=A0A4Z2BGS0_9TELE|nr:hypothetical protein fugu_003236 [Takifugu bimaculatus]